MLFRNCAGGIVFDQDKVFILKNEKGEWILPKGKIRNGETVAETAINRVNEETGINVEIISTAGGTSYEFFSLTRQRPVCNEITWYIMEARDSNYVVNKDLGFINGGFFDIDDAIKLITYSQDKSLINLSYKKFKLLKKEKLITA